MFDKYLLNYASLTKYIVDLHSFFTLDKNCIVRFSYTKPLLVTNLDFDSI